VPQSTPDIVSKLADKGEEALQKIAGSPAAQKLLDALTGLRDRIDELQRRVSGVEELEKRVAALEKQVKAHTKAHEPAARKPASAKKPAAPKAVLDNIKKNVKK
jgi:predicted RNA-binding Zn ribbon-like protein